jgi:hypothetical protein
MISERSQSIGGSDRCVVYGVMSVSTVAQSKFMRMWASFIWDFFISEKLFAGVVNVKGERLFTPCARQLRHFELVGSDLSEPPSDFTYTISVNRENCN